MVLAKSTGSEEPSTPPACVQFLGGGCRPQPHGSWQKRHQAPPDGRWQGNSFGLPSQCRQRPRREGAVADGGGLSLGQSWNQGASAQEALRGPGVRFGRPRVDPFVDGRRAGLCPPEHAARQRAGEVSLRGRTNHRRSSPEPATEDSLREAFRHTSSVPHTGLHQNLLESLAEET